MYRFMVIILLVSTLVACGSATDVPLTADAPAAQQHTALPSVATPTASAVPSPTARSLQPTATYVPTETAAPTTPPTPTTAPTTPSTPTTAPTTPPTPPVIATQPVAQTASADRSTVTGTVQIDAQRPIPPNAVLSIQLHRVNQDGITFSNVLDEQQSPISEPKPVAFELAYTRPDLVPIPGGGIPEAYLVYAELRAPGRVTWRAESEPLDLQTSPVSVTVMLTPPAHIGEISGTLTIPDQPTLPADAVLTVRLTSEDGYGGFDDNRAELVVTPVKPGKLPFILEYLTMAIDAQHSYAIHAEVRVGAKLPLTSPLVPAITQGQPTNVDAVLTPPKEIAAVTGTMMYEAGQPLPADALLTVQIEDVSGADGPSYVLASHTMKPDSSPIPFAIEYDPALIRRSADYAVSAKITAGEQLLFITEMRNMVITSGDSKPVEMVLKRIK